MGGQRGESCGGLHRHAPSCWNQAAGSRQALACRGRTPLAPQPYYCHHLGLPHSPRPPCCSIYFNPTGGKPGILGKSVAVSHKDHPADWFEGLPPKSYRARIYTFSVNKYGVKAGKDQVAWEQSGWIKPQDPRGWFQWYCRFYEGEPACLPAG